MEWYYIALIILGGMSCLYGLSWAVVHTDDLTDSSTGCFIVLWTWLIFTALGPIVMPCDLLYKAGKYGYTKHKERSARKQQLFPT